MGTGGLLVGFGSLVYGLFTLLPNSATQMLSFPWALIWQLGLLSLVVATVLKLWQPKHPFYLLGNGLDWAIVALVITLVGSGITAQFLNYAIWYGLTALGFVATLYLIPNLLQGYVRQEKSWLGLWHWQGYLSLIFAIESLLLWFWQIYLPKIREINELKLIGITEVFDFGDLLNRNGEPFSHPNYTAGYILLSLPIFISLSIISKGKQRWLWLGGIVIFMLTLYTTSSRGGFLGLLAWGLVAGVGLLWQGSLSKLWILGGGSLGLAVVAGLVAMNTRLRNLFTAITTGTGGGELLYRLVTSYAGWQMGLDHWLLGAGLGSGFLLYQRYRPLWAATEAEMLFQLHSTPVQIWAELGLAGSICTLVLIFVLVRVFIKLHQSDSWRQDKDDRTFTYGLFSSLFGYGILALTDYQLDVLAISGLLIFIGGTIAFIAQKHLTTIDLSSDLSAKRRKPLALLSTATLVVSLVWLVPFNGAWQNASVGFMSLANAYADLGAQKTESGLENLDKFRQRLESAHNLAPWHLYYLYQLGWNLANVSIEQPQIANATELKRQGLSWLEKSIALNPNYEFPYTNAAALRMSFLEFKEAIPLLEKAIKLAPHKRSLNSMLGFSLIQDLIRQKQLSFTLNDPQFQKAVTAFSQELINDPISITNPLWNNPLWRSILINGVMPKMEDVYRQNPQSGLQMTRATLRWWLGDPDGGKLLRETGNPTALLLADITANKPKETLNLTGNSLSVLTANAHTNPKARVSDLTKAFTLRHRQKPSANDIKVLESMANDMNRFNNLADWIRQPIAVDSPYLLKYRVGGGAGFNVINRNVDGANVVDFYEYQESAIAAWFFSDLFPRSSFLL